MNKFNEACKSFGMAINVKKTKVMVIRDKGKATCNITLDNTTIEQVTQYKYLKLDNKVCKMYDRYKSTNWNG